MRRSDGLVDESRRSWRSTAASGGGSSGIYEEFEHQLVAWENRDAARPERAMLRMSLLALEREENVVVAYRPSVLGPRLAAMPVPGAVRDLIRRALAGVWNDEEMHAVYMRAALLEIGSPAVSARTLLHQMAGCVGGWTVAVRQHRRWRQAPLSRAAAMLITWAGACAGCVPRTVRAHLDYCSFRDFCRYNVETESTAWLCWQRLTELAARVPLLSGARVDDFARIAEDEDRHRRIFQILADALTDDDELQESMSADILAARIGIESEPADARPHNEPTGRTSTTPQRIDRSRRA